METVKSHFHLRTLNRCHSFALAVLILFSAATASADVTLLKLENGWEVFTGGRVNAFGNYFKGQGYPQATLEHEVVGGGVNPSQATVRVVPDDPMEQIPQGTLEGMRVRSGFLSNVLGFGVRRQVSESVRITGYFEIWAPIEALNRRKFYPVNPDIRQGWAKIEGPWGSVVAGRSLSLFSRGATMIDFFYAHGYALGFAPDIESQGPTNGHIGTGVLGSSFNAGIVYATPVLGGFQLSVGAYDPSPFAGAWERNKYLRPEFEATYELDFGKGKFVAFANGGYHWLYRHNEPESTGTTVYGLGYGGRVEFGPVRLGASGYRGKGVGLFYAFENSDGNFNVHDICQTYTTNPDCMQEGRGPGWQMYEPRFTDGVNVIAQLKLGKVDLSGGWGFSQLHLLDIDRIRVDKAMTPDNPDDDVIPYSNIKRQTGFSAVAVFHASENLHIALDWFRIDARWYKSEKQVVDYVSLGTTINW